MNVTIGVLDVSVRHQRTANLVRMATAGTAAVAGLILTGCGGSTGGGSSGSTSPPATGVPSMTGAAPMTVTVIEKDFSIELSEKSFTPGTHTFRVENQGSSPHDLNIKGPGLAGEESPTIRGGGTAELTVALEPGTYQLWCSVDGHRAKGMDTTITVG